MPQKKKKKNSTKICLLIFCFVKIKKHNIYKKHIVKSIVEYLFRVVILLNFNHTSNIVIIDIM